MRRNAIGLAGTIALVSAVSAMAAKPLSDYGFIRGVCHPGGWRGDRKTLEGDLGHAKRRLMWDIMNEPIWNDSCNQASEAGKPKRVEEIKAFPAHFNKYVKSIDPVDAATIGRTFAKDIEWRLDVDVFSFRDYLPTRAQAEWQVTSN
jgi:hypothetical protein